MKKQLLPLLLLIPVLASCGGDSGSNNPSPPKTDRTAEIESKSDDDNDDESIVIFGDADKGLEIFRQDMCSECHVEEGDGIFSGFPIDPNDLINIDENGTQDDLTTYIAENMPTVGKADSCAGECAIDAAAYIWSFRNIEDDVDLDLSACDTFDNDIIYGRRSVKLLTSWEYHNSLEIIFDSNDLPADYGSNNKYGINQNVGFLPNHIHASVATALDFELYLNNARELAIWAMANNALPNSCNTPKSQDCADDFVNDFASIAFRRPLTDDEANDLQQLILEGITDTSGLEWAVQSVLASPQFLYHSELGVQVKDVIDNGWGIDFSGQAPASNENTLNYTAAKGGEKVNGTDFTNQDAGEDVTDSDKNKPTYNIYTTGSISHDFDFEGKSFVEIEVRGSDYDDTWPQMTIEIDGNEVFNDYITHRDLQVYEFIVDLNGNQSIEISFANQDEGREPYDEPGNDKNLYVGDVSVSKAIVKDDNSNSDINNGDANAIFDLSKIDSSAYVLDPFEYAAAISFMYTGTTPDRDLYAAVLRGDMDDKTKVEAHIERMIDSDRGRDHLKTFVDKWMGTAGVDKATRNIDAFTDEVKTSMIEEVREFYTHVFYEDAPFSELFDANYTMADSTLEKYYGLDDGGNNHLEFKKVNTQERGGLLTMGAWHAKYAHKNRTSPIVRSVHVRQDILCQEVPQPGVFDDPKKTLEENEADADADKKIRAQREDMVAEIQKDGELTDTNRYFLLTDIEACAGCHEKIINPLFALDDFDHVGLPRKREGNKVLQKGLGENGKDDLEIEHMQGYIYGLNDIREVSSDHANGNGLEFSGAKDLSTKLAKEDAVKNCFVEKNFRFATGLPTSIQSNKSSDIALSKTQFEFLACANERIIMDFDSKNQSPKALLKAIGLSDILRFRTDK